MIRRTIKAALRAAGYDIYRLESNTRPLIASAPTEAVPAQEPIWPLPRRDGGPSPEEIRETFASFKLWHYAYRFEGDLEFNSRHMDAGTLTDRPERPLQRFRHFMPYLLDACGGSLAGKRVLDIACNSGFWSLQCALLGAEVVGFDARQELIDQANALKNIVGADQARFQVLDFWAMSPEALGGQFDVVLNLGILYHLPKPMEALELTKAMSRNVVLLDTQISESPQAIVRLAWEASDDIRAAADHGMVAYPSKRAIEMMLRHMRIETAFEVPLRTDDMPDDYLEQRRASWLIRV